MCGIAGYLGRKALSQNVLESCLSLMHRRGPDSADFYANVDSRGNRVYMLSSRLNIIDLDDRANQPYRIDSEIIVFNGELYNYVELRNALLKKGIEFRTNSDTEVLLNILRTHGLDALQQCEGMWAFAKYDESTEELTLCRDRFGEKPLYMFDDGTGIYFGSEVKFIAKLQGDRLPINYDHLHRYMVNGYKSIYRTGETFFDGVSELRPGTAISISSDGVSNKQRYWHPRYDPEEDMSYEEAVAGARERLITSVGLRLRADVPMAFCMSGGVDSNALISIAKNVYGYDVHGFTIIVPDERYNEKELVDYSVEQLGIKHSSITANPDLFLPRLKELVRQHDAPVHTINYFAHWLLMESISEQGYRISVSGTGADELFTGYYDHHLAYLNDIKGSPTLHENAKKAWARHVRPIVRNPFLRDPDLFINSPNFRDHIFLDSKQFSSCMKNNWKEDFEEYNFSDSLLRNRMLNEMFVETVPPILHEDDLNAMYYSIENRAPYLDKGLFEFCYSIPTRHLMGDAFTKIVLRDSVSGIVPGKILSTRQKIGFNAPISSFLDVENAEVKSYLLDESPIFDHVHKSKISDILSKAEVSEPESKFLFYFLNSKMFLEEFGG